MKTTLNILLLFVLFQGHAQNFNSGRMDWDLIGPVKSCELRILQKGGPFAAKPKSRYKELTTIRFDHDGNVLSYATENRDFDSIQFNYLNGNLTAHEKYSSLDYRRQKDSLEYSRKDSLIEWFMFDYKRELFWLFIQWDYDSSDRLSSKKVYGRNQLQKEIKFNYTDTSVTEVEIHYDRQFVPSVYNTLVRFLDPNGQVIQENTIQNDTVQSGSYMEYDENGLLIKKVNYDFRQYTNKTTNEPNVDSTRYTYNSQGQIIEKQISWETGSDIFSFVYDSLGNCIREEKKRVDRNSGEEQLFQLVNAEYNDHGQLILKKLKFMKSSGYKGHYKELFEYDERGNWTKKIKKDKGKRILIQRREIIYFS